MSDAGAMQIVLDVVFHVPIERERWWDDGATVPALAALLRAHGLWFELAYRGIVGDPLVPGTDDDTLRAWSADWEVAPSYRLTPRDPPGFTTLTFGVRRNLLRVRYRLDAAIVDAHRADLLDRLVAWVRAVHGARLAGGMRVRRGNVSVEGGDDLALGGARGWDTGALVDVIDRDTYPMQIAANYWRGDHGTEAEGAEELARVLAAPAPPTSVRIDDGTLVIWQHVRDLTDPAAIEQARRAQYAWLAGLVAMGSGE